jgi:hypothetical protein
MPPNSSTSSSRRRRGLVALVLFASTLAALFAASAWRLETHGLARTREDRIAHAVASMRGVDAEAIVLSDSVTTSAAYPARPAPGVYMMLTNGYLRLLGQYLLFRRFLEHNHARHMFLFILPAELIADIPDDTGGGLARYTYVDSVFTRPDERRILDAAGAHPKREIEWRFERMLKTWYPDHQSKPFSLDLFRIDPVAEPVDPDPTPRKRVMLTGQTRYTLERFQESCVEHRVECTLVQVPTRPGVERFDMAELHTRFPGLRFVDMHDFVHYAASAFPDGMHPDRVMGRRYLRRIQAHVAPLFAENDSAWDGSAVAFHDPASLALFSADTFHDPESWGAWSSEASLSMRFRLARDLPPGVLEVAVRAPQLTAEPMQIACLLDGQRMANAASEGMETRTLSLALPAGLPAGSHRLEVRIPRTVNPRALGISPDARELGPGIVSIAYQPRAGPSPGHSQ